MRSMLRHGLLLILFPLLGLAAARAVAQGGLRLTLDDAVVRALTGNQELRAARLEIDRAEGRLRQAGRLSNPEIELVGRSERAISPGQGSTLSAALAQSFPVTNRLALSRRVAQLDLEKARAEVRERERIVAGETARSYIETQRAAAREAETRATLRLNQESLATARARFQGGQAPQAEAGLAELETQRTEGEIEVLAGETRAALARLRGRLGVPVGTALGLTESIDSIIARLGRRSGGAVVRADLVALGLAGEAARTERELAAKEAWGDWKLSLGIETTRKKEGSVQYERERDLGLMLTVPLPLWNGNEGRQVERRAAADQFRLEAAARQGQLAAGQEEVRERIAGLRRQIAVIRERTFPLLRQTETALLEAYRSAGRDLTSLFLVRREHGSVHLTQINALAEIALLLAESETQRGAHPALRSRAVRPR